MTQTVLRIVQHLVLVMRNVLNIRVIQSDFRMLSDTIESDIGSHWNPTFSGSRQPDLPRFLSDSFRSDSGPEYIGKYPIRSDKN